jgi:ATP-dependent exoDNAse (exonuclease V) beta subunit
VLSTLDLRRPDDLAKRVQITADKLDVRKPKLRGEAQKLIAQFLESPRAGELRRARQLHREVEFLLPWPPSPAKPGGRYLQGYLDCLYQDASGLWHVLDYKTNRHTADNLAELTSSYEMQMLAYAAAAAQALREPVADAALHFLRTGSEHVFNWDDAARRRAIEIVTVAIDVQSSGSGPPDNAGPRAETLPEQIG